MASLVIDLENVRDLHYAAGLIAKKLTELGAGSSTGQVNRERNVGETKGESDSKLRSLVESLMQTKTWKILIDPFAKKLYPAAATIEEMGEVMPIKKGIDKTRKAHTVRANLGKWEARTGIKIFVPVEGKPQKYELNPEVYDIAKKIDADRPAGA